MIRFTNPERAGLLPQFLSLDDPRPAVEQLDGAYAHGGGWCPFEGFRFFEGPPARLEYPDDPPMREVSRALLRAERVILFESDWVAVVQPDGKAQIARMD